MNRRQLEPVRTGICRREFFHRCAVCAGVVGMPPAWIKLLYGAQQKSPCSKQPPAAGPELSFHYFSRTQAATIEAVTDQIIPADQDPGAKWAGVVHYIDLALAGDLDHWRPIYSKGIERLEAIAHTFDGKTFGDLQFADQTKVLEQLERDQTMVAEQFNSREFFELVRKHTLEGFFGDTKYGGNRESVAWRILNFEA